jgi:ketosteroid isomerase-like protein
MTHKISFPAFVVSAIMLLAPAATIAQSHAHSHAAKSTPSATDPATAQITLDSQFRAALKAGNAQLAASFLSDDVLIFEGGGVERSKAEYQSHHLISDVAFASATNYEVTNRKVQVWGDTAVSPTEGRTTGQWRDRPINNVGTETMIMRRERGQWKIVHIHWSNRNVTAR